MMNLFKRLRTLGVVTLLAMTTLTAWAGKGHDHGEAPVSAAGLAQPRFSAVSENFELVGVVNGKQISLYLDRTSDNSPVKDAKIELELGGVKVDVKPHGEGEFEAMLAQELKPGEIAVSATVFAGKETDLLAGDLDIHKDTHTDEATSSQAWKLYGLWALGVLSALALMVWGWRRVRANRINRVGGVA